MNEPLEQHSGEGGGRARTRRYRSGPEEKAGRLELSAHCIDWGTEALGGTKTVGKKSEDGLAFSTGVLS